MLQDFNLEFFEEHVIEAKNARDVDALTNIIKSMKQYLNEDYNEDLRLKTLVLVQEAVYQRAFLAWEDYDNAEYALNDLAIIEDNLNKDIRPLLLIGDIRKHVKDYAGSLAAFNKALEWQPDSKMALYYRAELYMDMSRNDMALAEINKLIQIDAGYYENYRLRARIYKNMDDYVKALDDYNTAIDLLSKPENVKDAQARYVTFHDTDTGYTISNAMGLLYMLRADAYRQLRQYDSELADIEIAIKVSPDHYDAWFMRGNYYRLRSVYDKAIPDFTESLRLAPEYSKAYNNRGACYLMLKEYAKAAEDYSAGIFYTVENDKYKADLLQNRAICYDYLGEFDKCLEDYSLAYELNRTDYDILYNRAITYLRMKKYDEAFADLDKAMLNDRSTAKYANKKGQALTELSREDEALNTYTQAIANKAANATTYFNRAEIYLKQENKGAAFADLQAAVALDPKHFDATFKLYRMALDSEQYEIGIDAANKVIPLAENPYSIMYNRSYMYECINDLTNAAEGYLEIIRLKPDYPDTYYNLGGVYYKLKEFDKAAEAYTNALNQQPNNAATIIKFRGMCLRMAGKLDLAIADFDKAKQMGETVNPDLYKPAEGAAPQGEKKKWWKM